MDSILLDVRGTQSAADCRPPALRSRPSFTRVVCRPANITRCRVSVSGLERLLGRHACNATVRGGVAYPYVARRPEHGKQTSWDCGYPAEHRSQTTLAKQNGVRYRSRRRTSFSITICGICFEMCVLSATMLSTALCCFTHVCGSARATLCWRENERASAR